MKGKLSSQYEIRPDKITRHIYFANLGKSQTKQYLIYRSMNILFNQITIMKLPRKTHILNNIHAKAITVKRKPSKEGEILQLYE